MRSYFFSASDMLTSNTDQQLTLLHPPYPGAPYVFYYGDPNVTTTPTDAIVRTTRSTVVIRVDARHTATNVPPDPFRHFPTRRELNNQAAQEMAYSRRPRTPRSELSARHGFQQLCRLPCYRGTRVR
jgi:hypothetical protein